jgi:hypothetical protein
MALRLLTASPRHTLRLPRPAWLCFALFLFPAGLINCGLFPAANASDLRQLLTHPEFQVARSTSGQFIVAAHRSVASAPAPSRYATRATNLVELSSDTLVVSCEAIKSALLRTLHLPDAWQGRIHIILNPRMTNGQPAFIGAKPFVEGWQYQVDLPLSSEPIKIVRGIVHVLLLELANRNAGLRSAEIPLWLSEGLTQHLYQSSQAQLVVPRPRTTVRQVQVGWDQRLPAIRDPLHQVRDHLQSHAALSFARMGEFDSDQLFEESWPTFQLSTQLFVDQLLLLPRSREMLVRLLQELPHHLNWQVAFLKTFRPHFPRMLDVEKWWSVVLVHFTGLDSLNSWPVEIALLRLQEALHPPVLVAKQPKELPERDHLSIQNIIQQFDYLRQRILLQGLSQQLGLLRTRMPLPVVPVLDDYRRTIAEYLQRRDRSGMSRSLIGLPHLNADGLVQDTLQKLDELDRQRASLSAQHAGTSPASTTARLAP